MEKQQLTVELKRVNEGHPEVSIHDNELKLAKRIKELIGDQSTASFGRRCGIGESTLRKYLAGALPHSENLVAIADAGNVEIAWLAAGRGPKQRGASIHALPVAAAASPAAQPVAFGDVDRLASAIAAVQEGLDAIQRQLPAHKHAQLIAAAYDLLDSATSNAKVVQFIKLAA